MLPWSDHSFGQKSMYWFDLGNIFNIFGFFFTILSSNFTNLLPQNFNVSHKRVTVHFFFGNLNSYEHITRFYKNTRIYQQKNIISTFLGTGGHFPDFQLTLSQFAPFQFSLARVIVHFIFIKLNLYTHLSQFQEDRQFYSQVSFSPGVILLIHLQIQ